MSGMRSYYLSRVVVCVAFGLLLYFTGAAWWMVVLMMVFSQIKKRRQGLKPAAWMEIDWGRIRMNYG